MNGFDRDNLTMCRKQFNLMSGTDKIPQFACWSFFLEESDKTVAALVFKSGFFMLDLCT